MQSAYCQFFLSFSILQLLYYTSPSNVLLKLQQDVSRMAGKHPQADEINTMTVRKIENISKKLMLRERLDNSDVKSVEILARQLGRENALLYFEQQEVGGRGIISKHLQLAFMLPFQRELLRTFGKKLIFADAVFGLNRRGYPTCTLLVKDEFGHGCPVAFCIASNEDSDIWSRFIKSALDAAGLEPEYVCFMIDNSNIEQKAIRDINSKFILCHFHMLQDADRFLRSSESGAHGPSHKQARVAIIRRLQKLQYIKQKTAFQKQSRAFVAWLDTYSGGFPKVQEWYKKNVEGIAEHWASKYHASARIGHH